MVVVGSLDKQLSTTRYIDRDLQPYYQRPPFEPASRITAFDRMRSTMWRSPGPKRCWCSPRIPSPRSTLRHLAGPAAVAICPAGSPGSPALCAARPHRENAFSFTGDSQGLRDLSTAIQFFREYDFTPSRSAVIFFGLLVHQTIEEIHRLVLDGQFSTLNATRIRALFERTFAFLTMADVRPVGQTAKESAFTQVMNYFRQNQEEMQRVIETEVDVSVEKDGYILTGKVDLLLGSNDRLELLDFKTSPKPVDSPTPHHIRASALHLRPYPREALRQAA